MATRAELKAQLRAMLGLPSDDPLASDAVLNPIINQAYQGLVAECADVAPDAFKATASITITAQYGSTPTDVFQVRAVRDTDSEGMDLNLVPDDEIPMALDPSYSIVGAAAPFSIHTSAGFPSGTLWMSYTKGADNELVAETTVPSLLPTSFHDVIALEALWSVGLGNEQTISAALDRRRADRKGMLMSHLSRLGGPGMVSHTRLVAGAGEWP